MYAIKKEQKKKSTTLIAQIVLPTKLRQHFDYLIPEEIQNQDLQPGIRVIIPFRKKQLIGILINTTNQTDVPIKKLKYLTQVLDQESLIDGKMFAFGVWASRYYHYSLGEILFHFLPSKLRQGKPAQLSQIITYQLSKLGKSMLTQIQKNAPKQKQALELLQQKGTLQPKDLQDANIATSVINRLIEKQWVIKTITQTKSLKKQTKLVKKPELNTEQQIACDTINKHFNQFQTFLLNGITGSGKTEVYLQIIENVLNNQQQALILVPEIGLTPQTISRFSKRFQQTEIAILHSGLTAQERLDAWLMAKTNQAQLVIGTRSAIFSDMPKLSIIIVDEEHDTSFKQQDTFRYSARDLAIFRGKQLNIPVVLGSATPSLESLHNAKLQRSQILYLNQRAGNACQPDIHLIDIRAEKISQGLSSQAIIAIKQHLERNNQVLVFLNRRGYSPCLLCHACGTVVNCSRCEKPMTLHQQPYQLHCHHCDSRKSVPSQCPQCRQPQLISLGQGTQRLEEALKQKLPGTDIVRIDSDTTKSKNALAEKITQLQHGQKQILIGTQMLTKGHHFPNVTLVIILDADQGLFSLDFRASERLAQLITQVSGRSGRANKSGEVLIQTHHPQHPLLLKLLEQNYSNFADNLLLERQQACLPPYSHLALLRVEAANKQVVAEFLNAVNTFANHEKNQDCLILGPIPAPMEKRAGRFRYQLLLQHQQRAKLHQLVEQVISFIESTPQSSKVRWSMDIDPQDLY